MAAALTPVCATACGPHNPTTPANHPPAITGIAMSTQVIRSADTAVVAVHPTDRDGDTLVHDWIGTTAIQIRPAPAIAYVYNGPADSAVVLHNAHITPVDTAWIECRVRDRKGSVDGAVVPLIVHE
jgi:hypothetical protein